MSGLTTHLADAQIITPKGDGTYQRHVMPGTRPGERLRLDPIPGTGTAAIYDGAGRRVGVARQNSYGGVTVYDRRGTRVR